MADANSQSGLPSSERAREEAFLRALMPAIESIRETDPEALRDINLIIEQTQEARTRYAQVLNVDGTIEREEGFISISDDPRRNLEFIIAERQREREIRTTLTAISQKLGQNISLILEPTVPDDKNPNKRQDRLNQLQAIDSMLTDLSHQQDRFPPTGFTVTRSQTQLEPYFSNPNAFLKEPITEENLLKQLNIIKEQRDFFIKENAVLKRLEGHVVVNIDGKTFAERTKNLATLNRILDEIDSPNGQALGRLQCINRLVRNQYIRSPENLHEDSKAQAELKAKLEKICFDTSEADYEISIDTQKDLLTRLNKITNARICISPTPKQTSPVKVLQAAENTLYAIERIISIVSNLPYLDITIKTGTSSIEEQNGVLNLIISPNATQEEILELVARIAIYNLIPKLTRIGFEQIDIPDDLLKYPAIIDTVKTIQNTIEAFNTNLIQERITFTIAKPGQQEVACENNTLKIPLRATSSVIATFINTQGLTDNQPRATQYAPANILLSPHTIPPKTTNPIKNLAPPVHLKIWLATLPDDEQKTANIKC
jgi:hypothetical protein